MLRKFAQKTTQFAKYNNTAKQASASKLYSSAANPSNEPNFLDQVQMYFAKAAKELNNEYDAGLLNMINEVDCVYEFIIPHVRVDKVYIFFFLLNVFNRMANAVCKPSRPIVLNTLMYVVCYWYVVTTLLAPSSHKGWYPLRSRR